MSTSDNPSNRIEPRSVESLADEYLDRLRRGERPQIDDYARRYPDLADEIREFFPAMRLVESMKPDSRDVEPDRGAGAVENATGRDQLSIPDQLGDYRILREVARGGMGVVYEAIQESLGRPVALKVLPQSALPDRRRRERFEREARAVARLHHTNIVPVFAVGEIDDVHFYAMQFIEGPGLDAVLRELKRLRDNSNAVHDDEGDARNEADVARESMAVTAKHLAITLTDGQFPCEAVPNPESQADEFSIAPPEAKAGEASDRADAARETSTGQLSGTSSYIMPGLDSGVGGPLSSYWQSIARIGVQAAGALQHAHDQGVLHRDVKPSNLLLDRRGTVWVTDFGLAKTGDQEGLTRTGDVVGTLRYMAPEVFQGKADVHSDVYSLGLTLYELLALRPAFDERDRQILIRRVMQEAPPRLRSLDRRIPRDLETIVNKAIDRSPAGRYQTAGELAADLQRFLGDEPVRARRHSTMTRLVRWCRRNRTVAALAGLLSILIVSIAVVSTIAAASFRTLAKEKSDALNASIAAESQTRSLQESTAKALSQEIAAGRRERLRLAQMEFLRGRMLCNRGRISEGLLWMARGLNTAETAGPLATNLQRVIRINLDGWRQRICPLQSIVQSRFSPREFAANSQGRYAMTGSDFAKREWAIVWNLADTSSPHSRIDYSRSLVQPPEFTPDGRFFVCQQSNVTIWEAARKKKVATIAHPNSRIERFAVSRDSRWLVTGDGLGELRLWEIATGRQRGRTMRHPDGDGRFQYRGITRLLFSPDGSRILSTRQNTARMWDVGKLMVIGEPMVFRRNLLVTRAMFSPDGKRFVLGSSQLEIRDTKTRNITGKIRLEGMSRIYCIAFSPDGKTLLTGGSNHLVRFWSAVTARPLGRPLQHEYPVAQMNFSPDGQLLLVRSGNSVRLWNVPSRRLLIEPIQHSELLTKLLMSPDGQSFLTHRRTGLTRIWRMPRSEFKSIPIRPGGSISRVAFWPNEDHSAIAGQRVVFYPRLTRFYRPGGEPYPIMDVAYDTGGQVYCVVSSILPETNKFGDIRVYVLKVPSRLPRGRRPPADRLLIPPFSIGKYCDGLAMSPDGRRVLTMLRGKQTMLWDISKAGRQTKPVSIQKHRRLTAMGFRPGRNEFFTISSDGSVKRWNSATGQLLGPVFAKGVGSRQFAFSPDGLRIAFADNDQTVKVWDIAQGEMVFPPLRQRGAVRSIALTPDNRSILIGGLDGGIRLWDGATGEQLGPTLRHTAGIKSTAIRSDGRQILAASRLEFRAKLWRSPRPMSGKPELVRLQLEVDTGLELTDSGTARELSPKVWQQRQLRLRARTEASSGETESRNERDQL